jgi:hypothetical protein
MRTLSEERELPTMFVSCARRCAAHNRLHAEETFGRDRVDRAIHLRRNSRSRTSASQAGKQGVIVI